MWLAMITLHSLAGLLAFVVGVAALQPVRARRHRWLAPLLVGLVVALVVFMIAAMATHWTDLAPVAQVVFSSLVGLGVYMLYRALRARSLLAHEEAGEQLRYMDDVGFVLIALLDGFVIVAALDLGLPPWIVTAAGFLAVAIGHYWWGEQSRPLGWPRRRAQRTSLDVCGESNRPPVGAPPSGPSGPAGHLGRRRRGRAGASPRVRAAASRKQLSIVPMAPWSSTSGSPSPRRS